MSIDSEKMMFRSFDNEDTDCYLNCTVPAFTRRPDLHLLPAHVQAPVPVATPHSRHLTDLQSQGDHNLVWGLHKLTLHFTT